MTKYIIVIVVACIGSNGLFKFLEFLIRRNDRTKKQTPQDRMLLALGRYRLLRLCKHYLEQGYIPSDEWDVFDEMGKSYLDMNGNSRVKARYYECRQLPEVDEVGNKI